MTAATAPGIAAGIGPVVAGSPSGEPVDAAPVELDLAGPSGTFRVWLGDSRDPGALEADVRAVCDSGVPRPAVAVALGEVARRHKLEVRVIPRVDDRGELLLVVFGARVPGSRR